MNTFNDSIEIYAKREGDKIILSDDGETLYNLELGGASITRSQKRKQYLDNILNNYGITLAGASELTVVANEKSFAQKKLNLLSAISEANDLYVLSKHSVESVFKEDVQKYLDEQGIIYTPHFISKGSTGLEFTFDFQIAYQHTEIVIKAFNTINKMNLPQFLFTWNDIQPVRERLSNKKVIALAIVNDVERAVKAEYIEAIFSKNAQYLPWSKRLETENINKLRAS